MSDDGQADDKTKPERPQGDKFHYNPGNMAGEEAGIVEEIEQRQEEEERRNERHQNPDESTDSDTEKP